MQQRLLNMAHGIGPAFTVPDRLARLTVFASAPPPVPDIAGHASRLSIYIAKGAANSCGQGCDLWIAVEGKVDVGAAARIRQFLRKTKSAESLAVDFH